MKTLPSITSLSEENTYLADVIKLQILSLIYRLQQTVTNKSDRRLSLDFMLHFYEITIPAGFCYITDGSQLGMAFLGEAFCRNMVPSTIG